MHIRKSARRDRVKPFPSEPKMPERPTVLDEIDLHLAVISQLAPSLEGLDQKTISSIEKAVNSIRSKLKTDN